MFSDGAPATTAPFSTIFVPLSSVIDRTRVPGRVTVTPSWVCAVLGLLVPLTTILKPLICGNFPSAPGSAATPHSISSLKCAGVLFGDERVGDLGLQVRVLSRDVRIGRVGRDPHGAGLRVVGRDDVALVVERHVQA